MRNNLKQTKWRLHVFNLCTMLGRVLDVQLLYDLMTHRSVNYEC